MNETTNVELTSQQRDILLRGLRFVRSSVTMGVGEQRLDDEIRDGQVAAIDVLSQRLQDNPAEPAKVS